MKAGLVPGVTGDVSRKVTRNVTITLGSPPYARDGGTSHPEGGATVFATPYMIELMEHAARKAVEPYVDTDEETVGAEVNIRHLAATTPGQQVRARARLVSIEGRKLLFEIEAHDETQKIGEGTHTRIVITTSRFREKLGQSDEPAAMTAAQFAPESCEAILYQSEGGVGHLTLNRPKVLNALNVRMVEEIEALLDHLMGDERTRVLVVTGADRAFCAGDDIREVADLSTDEAEALSHRQARMFHRFHELPQPVIAAVNGPALGAGCVCALFADIRIASYAATFGMPEIKLGWAPGYGNKQLVDAAGQGRALELVLTGESIGAAEAHRAGLVERVVSHGTLLTTADDLARTMLATSPAALRETKRLIHADRSLDARESYRNDTAAYIRCFATDDAREGMAAFLQKRAPNWSDR